MLYHKPTFNEGQETTAGGPSSTMGKSKNQSLETYWKNKVFGGPILNPIQNGKKPNNLL